MIDMHIHGVSPHLPRRDPTSTSRFPLIHGPVAEVALALLKEMHESGTTVVLSMGQLGCDPLTDPLGIATTRELAAQMWDGIPRLYPIGIADPTRTDIDHMQRVHDQLQCGDVKALKAYLGYLHFGPDAYRPYFDLAADHNLPFIFHTGDTYSRVAKLRFAHPLLVDDVAVDYPHVKFVLAHFGNPWLIDAAEVIYKNDNVWADLSGLVGDADDLVRQLLELCHNFDDTHHRVSEAYRYVNRPERFLYGSDWPIVPMNGYSNYIETIIPTLHRKAVFQHNAEELFGLNPN